MIHADEDRCAEFCLDPKRVEAIARRLAKAAAEARALGLVVFGGSGHGSLRCFARGAGTRTVVASIGEGFDGGDGGDE